MTTSLAAKRCGVRCRRTGRARHRDREVAVAYRAVLHELGDEQPWWVVHCIACRGWHLYRPGDPRRAWLLLPSAALLARAAARHATSSAKSPPSRCSSGTLDPTAPAPC